jgi:hypothetical protein
MERRLASMRYEIASRDAITPFVCSTFKDFSKERNYLAAVVFPQIQGLDMQCLLFSGIM